MFGNINDDNVVEQTFENDFRLWVSYNVTSIFFAIAVGKAVPLVLV